MVDISSRLLYVVRSRRCCSQPLCILTRILCEVFLALFFVGIVQLRGRASEGWVCAIDVIWLRSRGDWCATAAF